MFKNIDWQITSKCNRSCKYCFGPKRCNEIDFNSIKIIIDTLYTNGVEQIGITGGEPLLHNEFPEIVDYIYNKGISIYLSTNCDYYNQYADLIKNKVSIIGIPIDGSNSFKHDSIRGEGSFSSVVSVMEDILNCDTNIRIKVGTVITNKNISDLKNIECFLKRFDKKILFWKLYELIDYDRNFINVKDLVPNKNWLSKCKTLGEHIDKNKIIIDEKKIRSNSYLFIKPNADVFIPILSDKISYEKNIGNILEDGYNTIIRRFQSIVNEKGYNEKFRFMKNV